MGEFLQSNHNYTLNENQSQAVEWGEGPLLVLAGPGSGKTLVLTLGFRILKGSIQSSRANFYNKAADEMGATE